MVETAVRETVAHLVNPAKVAAITVLGPTIQYVTEPEAEDLWPCVMQGTIPPGVDVPLHGHGDPETFLLLSGEVEGLSDTGDRFVWVRIMPGDVFHVPSGARHAFRNRGAEPAVMIIASTSKIGRFFREIGTPIVPGGSPPGPPTAEAIQRFLQVSDRYGYWNASAEENARVGISLPAA